MTAGTNMYSRSYKRSSVFFKSQVATAQLQEALTDCEFPIAMTDDCLLLGDITRGIDGNVASRKIKIYKFTAIDEDKPGEINLAIDKVVNGATESEKGDTPFCKHCSSVRYTPYFNPDGTAYAVKVNMTFSRYGISYNRNDVISLRNRPQIIFEHNGIDSVEAQLAERLEAIS